MKSKFSDHRPEDGYSFEIESYNDLAFEIREGVIYLDDKETRISLDYLVSKNFSWQYSKKGWVHPLSLDVGFKHDGYVQVALTYDGELRHKSFDCIYREYDDDLGGDVVVMDGFIFELNGYGFHSNLGCVIVAITHARS